MFIEVVNQVLSILVVLGQIFLVLGLVYFLLTKDKKRDPVLLFLDKYSLQLLLVVALIATLGSLFYSEGAGYEPCKLCWLQRIFMYPLVVLLLLANYRKDDHIVDYSLSLAIVGFFLSLYHNYIYYGGYSVFSCDAFGLGVSCSRRYVIEFGYITIPLMALTAFTLFIALALLHKYYQKNRAVV